MRLSILLTSVAVVASSGPVKEREAAAAALREYDARRLSVEGPSPCPIMTSHAQRGLARQTGTSSCEDGVAKWRSDLAQMVSTTSGAEQLRQAQARSRAIRFSSVVVRARRARLHFREGGKRRVARMKREGGRWKFDRVS